MPTTDEIRAQIAALQMQLNKAEEAERIERGKAEAIRTISEIAAFKELLGRLKAREGVLGQSWHDIPQQAQPREKLIAKAYDLSETELHNAKAKGIKAVASL